MSKTLTKKKVVYVPDVTAITIKNNYLYVPQGISEPASIEVVGTIFSNLAYYGYVLSEEAAKRLIALNEYTIKIWWKNLQPIFEQISGESRRMGAYVVYQNFPEEVLNMSEAQYWFNQIFMYLGVPNEFFTQEAEERLPLFEKGELKVLHLADELTMLKILDSLLGSPLRLNPVQLADALYLIDTQGVDVHVSASSFKFKENMILVVQHLMKTGKTLVIKSATDVLRLAKVLSGGELNSTEKVKFKKFSKADRRYFLTLLENSTNLEEDVARDPEAWKRFIFQLHPHSNRRKYPKVVAVASKLYDGDVHTFNSKVERAIAANDVKALTLSATRAGDFVRRLKRLAILFPSQIINVYREVAPKLTVLQLAKIGRYLQSTNTRKYRMFPPKGNWTKVQIVPNDGKQIKNDILDELWELTVITLQAKMNAHFPNGVNVDSRLNDVKLSASDSAAYGRGTAFPIPKDVTFIRTASYWESANGGYNTWFDNGWNFFTKDWEPAGTICWNSTSITNKAALFSGDPTNSKTDDGKACQMIDLYLDKLRAQGIRYAVWNILCYSNIKFSQATDVFAALQWGTYAQAGKLFEPSRAQIAFPLTDNSFTKFIAYIDLAENKLVFLDANFKGNVQSAVHNSTMLSQKMPAMVEYLHTLPSVYDLFEDVTKGTTPILYSDKDVEIKNGQDAYVFKPEREGNVFTQLDLNKYL